VLPQRRKRFPAFAFLLTVVAAVACSMPGPAGSGVRALQSSAATGVAIDPGAAAPTSEQVLRGRQLVIAHGCGDCHGGFSDPGAEGWLAGLAGEEFVFPMETYRVWSRNLTPDTATGMGRYTDRQIFNALRYGLRPGETPDIEITSPTPGVGNHPAEPNYLAPVMLWTSFRHMSDRELLDIIAYLRHVEPVANAPPEGVRPADNWASAYTAEKIGSPRLAAFPTAHEELRDPERREQVLQGRTLVVTMGCGDCHGGRANPAGGRWLNGYMPAEHLIHPGPFEIAFPIGPFTTYPRNLTPDNSTGLGRFSERQIFNALRYGLRPGETADMEITSTVPGVGNHPIRPKYLAPPMPWPAWRHLPDDALWAIAAYLKYGVKAAANRVPDSEGPPDFWAEEYLSGKYGPYPAPPFPAARERLPAALAGAPR
jgi:mono/diheme cytochrome c family protein